MADSIEDMGSAPLYFPLQPDWSNPPDIGFGIARNSISYPGTAAILSSSTELVPLKFGVDFLTTNKTDEYNLLEFLHAIRGRNKRFWIEFPIKMFQLKTAVLSGSSAIECEPNGFNKIVQGNERVFWVMDNGDLVVRKVTEASYSAATDIMTLVVQTDVDRDIALDDYLMFGRFLLARLDEDTIRQKVLTNSVTAWSMRFIELPDEYDTEEAS